MSEFRYFSACPIPVRPTLAGSTRSHAHDRLSGSRAHDRLPGVVPTTGFPGRIMRREDMIRLAQPIKPQDHGRGELP